MRATTFLALLSLSYVGTASAEMLRLDPSRLPSETRRALDMLRTPDARSMTEPGAPESDASQLRGALEQRRAAQENRRLIARSLLGRGYDLWRGELSETCLEIQDIEYQPIGPDGRNRHNIFNLRQVESLQEYHSGRSSGGSLSLAYDLFSFGGGLQEYQSGAFKTNSQAIDVYIRFVGDEYYVGRRRAPAPIVTQLLPTNVARFSELCGQHFISRVGFGINLDARIVAQAQMNQHTEANKAAVNVGFGEILGFSADSKTSFGRISSNASLSIVARGGTVTGQTPDDLLDYALHFGDPGAIGNSMQTVYIETTPYSRVGAAVFRDFQSLIDRAFGSVLGLQSDRLQTVGQLTDIQTARSAPQYFELAGVAAGDLDRELMILETAHRDYLDRLGRLFSVCQRALDAQSIAGCEAAASAVPARPARPALRMINQVPLPPAP